MRISTICAVGKNADVAVAPEPAAPAGADGPSGPNGTSLARGHLRVAAGWLVLGGAVWLVLPVFGVLSPVSWAASSIGWLWVIVAPVLTAVEWARRRLRR